MLIALHELDHRVRKVIVHPLFWVFRTSLGVLDGWSGVGCVTFGSC